MMEEISKYDKFLYAFIIFLSIFILGVQVEIAHEKKLQRQDYYDYVISN